MWVQHVPIGTFFIDAIILNSESKSLLKILKNAFKTEQSSTVGCNLIKLPTEVITSRVLSKNLISIS